MIHADLDPYGFSKNGHWTELGVIMVNVWNGGSQGEMMAEDDMAPVYFLNLI